MNSSYIQYLNNFDLCLYTWKIEDCSILLCLSQYHWSQRYSNIYWYRYVTICQHKFMNLKHFRHWEIFPSYWYNNLKSKLLWNEVILNRNRMNIRIFSQFSRHIVQPVSIRREYNVIRNQEPFFSRIVGSSNISNFFSFDARVDSRSFLSVSKYRLLVEKMWYSSRVFVLRICSLFEV